MRGIIGTAGHIDHGKTALIGALTGEHTDRLPEEQERGISIDLGFTHLDTVHGTLGVIDVPGHEDFIRNMLAGATGIDVLLLVVAADEGVMPQTREHAAIAELLGVHRAVVALSKVDRVDDDWLDLVHDDVAGFLAGTPFAGAPVVATSATEGTGLDRLRAAIDEVFAGTRGRVDDLFRMPVDRAFTVRGTGTVVTGTVWSGRLEKEATVRLLPGGPETRVRGLQVHGGDVDAVEAGQRAAIALTGVDRDELERGMAVVAGPGWAGSASLTTRMRVLPGSPWAVERWQRVRVHLGTAEVMARAVPLGADRLEPGDEGFVQLRLEASLLARAGDRFVVRSYSPVTTIGGGRVVEPLAPKRTGLDDEARGRLDAVLGDEPDAIVDALLRGSPAGAERNRLPVLTGLTPQAVAEAMAMAPVVEVGGRVFHTSTADAVRKALLAAVDREHEAAPLRPGVDPEALRRAVAGAGPEALVDHVLDTLLDEGALAMRRGAVGRPDHVAVLSDAQEALRDRVRETLAEAGVAPPRLDELRDALGDPPELDDLVALLEAEGALVRIEHDLFADAGVMDRAVRQVRDRLGGRTGLSPGDFRDVLDVSRRHLIPILGYLDRVGVTVRGREGRDVAG